MNNLLSGKIAIITGATAGIGRAIAEKFSEHGANVILIGTNRERGEAAVQDIVNARSEAKAKFYQVDVSNHLAANEAMKSVLEEYKQVDILVNNAGITRDQLLMRMTEKEWDEVMNVNVKSCYNTCHALVRAMMKAKSGKIINISSVIALMGNPGQTNYAASKAAIIGFTKALAKEVASRNICVNCLAPGFISTAMTDQLADSVKQSILNRIPLGCFGATEDVANAALFLASDLSRYITGQVISVDGGMSPS